eukprot:TRINITY_DN12428_c1_g1_i3.p1 TRINITY_DN12428_c1_g1~~TRINITY_DN12428_c1_g1_i3.p1  ORF type:complete len:154 (+),score=4.98 TRINITY_DN12428_c1_g1_i3:2-463(+)
MADHDNPHSAFTKAVQMLYFQRCPELLASIHTADRYSSAPIKLCSHCGVWAHHRLVSKRKARTKKLICSCCKIAISVIWPSNNAQPASAKSDAVTSFASMDTQNTSEKAMAAKHKQSRRRQRKGGLAAKLLDKANGRAQAGQKHDLQQFLDGL